ncbi:transporter substrate-binding domain-containing protein [Nocardia sp. 2]|uniref:Transporter substrate-binding domain-containing protein n=1 Tax=Nocardia acididurans TaxID=2802282 RepID=A0ABS1MCF5_9NOCA|nr:transporter substrate-binding domain-containing protein [Nocardia acididurans]MBL1077929.1 transporter substrate-binding domain-containing protein [Nocardia acididurans]
MRRRKLFAAVLAVAATVGLAACSSGDDANVLKVGTEGTYFPFSYQDNGQLTGYDVDVIKAVGDKIGRKVEFTQAPWDSLFAALDSGRVDLIANQVTIKPERAQKYSLSNPYTVSEGVVITKTGTTGIAGLADLSGKTCAQSETSNWAEVAKTAGCKVEAIPGFVEAVQLLKSDRANATVNDTLVANAYIKQNGNGVIQIVGKTGETSKQAFAARKDSQALTDQINTALAELAADGTLAKISDKYFGLDVSK